MQGQVCEDFISLFWEEVAERIAGCNMAAGPKSFSEAPAESVFSVVENILSGRDSLTTKHTTALFRVSMEGPGASTDASLKLSQEALENPDMVNDLLLKNGCQG